RVRRLSRRRGVSRFAWGRNHQGDNKGLLDRRAGNADNSARSPSSQLQTVHRTRHEMNMLADARVTSFASLLGWRRCDSLKRTRQLMPASCKAVASFSVLRRSSPPRPDLVTAFEGQSNTLTNTHA